MSQLITKDFYKADVYRFDTETLSGNMVKFDISNVISWELMSVKMTRDELKGLADFIYKHLENK